MRGFKTSNTPEPLFCHALNDLYGRTSYPRKPGKPYCWIFQICLKNDTQETTLHTEVYQGMTVNELYN